MAPSARGLPWLVALVLAAPPTALPGAPVALQPPRVTRDRMEAVLDGSERFLVVYGTRDPTSAPILRERAYEFARRFLAGDSSAVVADRDAPAATVGRRSVFLLGGPRENEWSRRLAPAFPVTFTTGGFRWQGTDYDRPDDVIHLVWPNPLDPARFALLIAGNSSTALVRRGAGMVFGTEDWRIYRDGEMVRSGVFAQSPDRPWRYDPALDRDLEALRARARLAMRPSGSGPVRVWSAPGTASTQPVLSAAEALLDRLDRMGLARPADTRASRAEALQVTLYPSLETKGELTRDTRPEHLDDAGAAHVAFAAGRDALDLWSVAAARLRRMGAAADSRWLAPAAIALCGRFEGEPLALAVNRLYFGRLLPRARDAATRPPAPAMEPGSTAWRSPLVWDPARAILVRAVFETAGARGRAALLSLLGASPPGTLDSLCRGAGVPAAAVERRYALLADSLARAGERATRMRAPRPWRPSDGFQSGVCLVHSVRLEGGYLSASCGRELVRLQGLGARWVSITPFGSLPDPARPEIVPGTDAGPDGESDEAVCEVAARARALGMRVWLVPHLWTRGFVGDLEFGPAGWSRFFERYREFILHYALMAQRERFDGLVVGHQLTRAALAYPDRWRVLIADVRRIYGGTITYGADGGEEVRGIAFWDALDLVGVSFYTPLADAPTHDVAALAARAHRSLVELKAVGARAGRPVLIVELGYTSRADAAVRPWEERGGAPDLEAQRACYEAMVKALEPETWIAGVFWWKWPSGGVGSGAGDASYSPRGKPAEAAMARGFSEWVSRPVTIPRAAAAPRGGSARP